MGKLTGDIPAAYRVVAAFGYAVGPAALYLATREISRSRSAAILAALAFMFSPSASYLLPGLAADAGAFSGAAVPPPWRLVALVEYGEGPHVLSLTLALLTLAAGARHVRAPSGRSLALAVLGLLSVALTNLIGLLGCVLFLALLPASQRLGGRAEDRYARVFVIFALAGLLSLGWYSLGFVRAVFGFSTPGGSDGGTAYLWLVPTLIATLVAVAWLERRLTAGAGIALGGMLIFGAILIARQAFGVSLAPQPIRYALELDAAAAMGIGIALAAGLRRFTSDQSPTRQRAVHAAAASVLILTGAAGWWTVHERLGPDTRWADWSERRVAHWLAENVRAGERAYVSGDHAFWLNAFSDVPQVRGGVDFAFANPWWAHVTYQVNNGDDADASVLWMQALPVRYVVVTGPESTDIYRDFAHPRKFDGKLRQVFDERGVRIYEVEAVGDANLMLARVGDLEAPESAVDKDALTAYVRAMAAGRAPVSMERRGLGSWRATVDAASGESLVLRQAFDSGWRATVDGRATTVRADAIGQLAIAVPPGSHVVEIDHEVHTDLKAGVGVAALTALLLLVVPLWRRYRRRA